MDKYCYMSILIGKSTDEDDSYTHYRWSVMLFKNVKIKKGMGQLATSELKGNWGYDTQEIALESAKKVLRALGVKKVKDSKSGTEYRRK